MKLGIQFVIGILSNLQKFSASNAGSRDLKTSYNGSNIYSKMGYRKLHYINLVCCLFDDSLQGLYHPAL